jgi:hypothetical protein
MTRRSTLGSRVTGDGSRVYIRLYRGPPVCCGTVQWILSKEHPPDPARVHVIFVGKESAYLGLLACWWLGKGMDSRFRGNDQGIPPCGINGKMGLRAPRIYLQS